MVGGLKLVAESTGGRRNQIDTILVCRVPEPGATTSDGRRADRPGAGTRGRGRLTPS